MADLETVAGKVAKKLRQMGLILLKADQPELCDLADQLADELDWALRIDPDEETGPVIHLGGSEDSIVRSSKDIREELAQVSEQMRGLKDKLKDD